MSGTEGYTTTSTATRVSRFADRYIPHEVRRGGDVAIEQARTLVVLSLVIPPVWLAYAVWGWTTGAVGEAVVGAVGAVAWLGLLPMLRLSGSLKLTGHTGLAIGLAAMTTVSILKGGYATENLLWVVVLPTAAMLLSGLRQSLIWGAVVTLVLTALFVFDELGGEAVGPNASMLELATLIGLTATLVWVTRLSGVARLLAEKERERLTERLASAERLSSIGTLAAGVSHEINNPLAYIVANLSYLREQIGHGAPDRQTRRELERAVAEAQDGAHRVAGIIRQLQTYAGTENGQPQESRSVSVHDILEDALQVVGNQVRQNAVLVREFADVPNVMAPPGELGQVFTNMLVNAAEAVSGEGAHTITLRTRPVGDGLVVEIEDTGAGVPPELRNEFFDPFFTTKEPGAGTGLGLSMCVNLVTKTGGTIAVTEAAHGGALFRVTLPGAGARPLTGPRTMPAVAESRRLRILIVDDEHKVTKSLRRILGSHEVTCVENAETALSRISQTEFDLILCDVMMPGVGGEGIFDQLELEAPETLERVVFMTGGAFTPEAQSFLKRVPNRVLYKPVRLSELHAVLQESQARARRVG